MKAISPVLPLRRSPVLPLELGVWRSKGSAEEPLGLLSNMSDCYSRLKELVPSLPRGRSVSRTEILQHVIDYILDLQTALDSAPPPPQGAPPERAGVPPSISTSSQSSRCLTEMTSDDHAMIPR